jgi:hypothetical protein
MRLSDNYKNLILSEIDFAVKKMNKSSEPLEKLFYFSAIHGIFQRIYNIEYDPTLVFIYFILHTTHEAFNNRLQAKAGIPLSEKQINKLSDIAKELGGKIKNNEEVSVTLQKFVVLQYSTSGNGYYLMQKGMLKI